MSIANTQAYLDWAAMQREDGERDAGEMYAQMTAQEREEYEAFLDTLNREQTHEPDRNKQP